MLPMQTWHEETPTKAVMITTQLDALESKLSALTPTYWGLQVSLILAPPAAGALRSGRVYTLL